MRLIQLTLTWARLYACSTVSAQHGCTSTIGST